MSFHLEGPWLTTSGKRKGKRKFRNAEEARRERELAESWQTLLKKHSVTKSKNSKSKVSPLVPEQPTTRRETTVAKSLPFTAGPCTKSEQKVYTGTECIGIAVMHKSCLQPIFNEEAAKDSAKMRR